MGQIASALTSGLHCFDPEPIPNPQDLFASLSKSCFFTKLDLTKGYWQIPMEECDKEKTAFVTPDGKFHFWYMPFGMVTASAQFSKLMRQVLVGVPNVVSFIDDTIQIGQVMSKL